MKDGSRSRTWMLLASLLAAFALIAAACGDSSDDGEGASTEAEAEETEAEEPEAEEPEAEEPEAEEPEAEEPEAEEPEAEEPEAEEASGDGAVGPGPYDFSLLSAPAGEPITIGFVNTEGAGGLNFPELEQAAEGSVEYLNEHGGLGDREIDFQTCVVDGSPEGSQACAQELAGKNVEMVWLGLDLFPDYATYDAAGIPVIGVIPLFAADYASDALYMNGGNATLAAAEVAVAVETFGAESVAIISADNAGANSSEAAAIAALDKAGIPYVSIKGAESETDAGAQGLVAQALESEPDALISLYADAGCIGMMRGRAALGSDVPVIASGTCANGEVIDAVGDDAEGWFFLPGGDRPANVENGAMREAVSGMVGVDAADVKLSELGLGALSPRVVFSAALAAQDLLATGGDVTGAGIADHMKANTSGNLRTFPDGSPLRCGEIDGYPALCDSTTFLGTYAGDGNIEIVEGFEQFDVSGFLA